jgi:peptidyl-prolyl cis-trans isomerase A (cyclophilin A)
MSLTRLQSGPVCRLALGALAIMGSALGGVASATIVRFETVLGNIDVRLFHTRTPLTTQNFLKYVDDGDWNDTFFHRSIPGFVVQGGGFKMTSANVLTSVPQDPPVLNEPGLTNVRGTIAMAKIPAVDEMGNPIPGGGPDSATKEWFFNLANNASNLDNQNGGFTAFGRVVGSGMSVVDAIAALPRVNAGGAFNTLPVRNFSGGNISYQNLTNVTRIIERDLAPGDYNFDGVVNNADYLVWKNSFGSTTLAEADGNGDGVVNAADYTVWRDSMAGAAQSVTIPEPTAAALVVLAAFGCGLRRRRV